MTEATAAVVRQPGGNFTIETIEVEAPRAGVVTGIKVQEGDPITEGQVLLTIA